MTKGPIAFAVRISRSLLHIAVFLLAGCQALVSEDPVATSDINATVYALEAAQLELAASADQTSAAATISAAGTAVASQSALNVAMGATLRAAYTPTAGVRAVVVNAGDLENSLDRGMMSDSSAGDGEGSLMRVWDVAMARSVSSSSGCSTGAEREFSADEDRIYLTARVSNLLIDTYFEADWILQGRVLYRRPWRATYSAASDCLWFYVTPEDFPFLPGLYSATLYVNGVSEATAQFTIAPAS